MDCHSGKESSVQRHFCKIKVQPTVLKLRPQQGMPCGRQHSGTYDSTSVRACLLASTAISRATLAVVLQDSKLGVMLPDPVARQCLVTRWLETNIGFQDIHDRLSARWNSLTALWLLCLELVSCRLLSAIYSRRVVSLVTPLCRQCRKVTSNPLSIAIYRRRKPQTRQTRHFLTGLLQLGLPGPLSRSRGWSSSR